MIHQIELQPEFEARLTAEAQARGLDLDRYILEKLEVPSTLRPESMAGDEASSARRLADLEEFFKEMARNAEKIPLLPDEAFTRESFYRDHN